MFSAAFGTHWFYGTLLLYVQTVQATYMLVLELLSASLEVLREECRQTALANQVLIRSNLDQIMSSHCFLEQKIRGTAH